MASEARVDLALRPMSLGDTDVVHAWARLPEVCRYQAWGPNSAEDTRRYVAEAVATAEEVPRRRYVWIATDATGRAVGSAELQVRSPQERCAELGYLVDPELWGRGYATRMAALVAGFAFDELGMHRVEATCDPRNAGSARVLRRLGMTHEGRRRHTMLLRDGWRDSELFGMLEDEWAASPQRRAVT